MSDPLSLNAQVRLIEMTSRTTYELDQNTNLWRIVSSEKSVTDQFNEWADQRDMNPHGTPSITQAQFVDSPERITIAFTLCVAVMPRKDQALLELAFREQTARLISANTCTSADDSDGSVHNRVPTAGTVAASNAESHIRPVNIADLGDESPKYPGKSSLPSRTFPGPGAIK